MASASASASAVDDLSSSLTDVLCSACRCVLPGVHPEDLDRLAVQGGVSPLTEDPTTGDLPDWVRYKIEEAGWTRGKLNCPACRSRVGGFDFVGASSDTPVYLVNSRVEVRRPVDLRQLIQQSRTAGGQQSTSGKDYLLINFHGCFLNYLILFSIRCSGGVWRVHERRRPHVRLLHHFVLVVVFSPEPRRVFLFSGHGSLHQQVRFQQQVGNPTFYDIKAPFLDRPIL